MSLSFGVRIETSAGRKLSLKVKLLAPQEGGGERKKLKQKHTKPQKRQTIFERVIIVPHSYNCYNVYILIWSTREINLSFGRNTPHYDALVDKTCNNFNNNFVRSAPLDVLKNNSGRSSIVITTA